MQEVKPIKDMNFDAVLERKQAEKEQARASAGPSSPMPPPQSKFGKTPPKVTRLATVTESSPAGRQSTKSTATKEGTSDSDPDSDSADDRLLLKSEKGSSSDGESAMDDKEAPP